MKRSRAMEIRTLLEITVWLIRHLWVYALRPRRSLWMDRFVAEGRTQEDKNPYDNILRGHRQASEPCPSNNYARKGKAESRQAMDCNPEEETACSRMGFRM